jgi:hypothetical protein
MSLVKCESWAANVLRAELNYCLDNLDHTAFIAEIAHRRAAMERDIEDIFPISPTECNDSD